MPFSARASSLSLLLIPLMGAALVGCGVQGRLIGEPRTVDSLRTENAILVQRNEDLADSLRFYDGINSGQYYREVRTLRDRLARLAYEVSVLRDGGLTVATLQADALFEPASATLRPHGVERLAEVAAHIKETYPDRRLRIEGHADNIPLGESLHEKYPSNWELSAARASTVARHLIDEHEMAPERFAVVGFGSTRPTATNDTAAGRWLNRRVRIAVLPTPNEFGRALGLSW